MVTTEAQVLDVVLAEDAICLAFLVCPLCFQDTSGPPSGAVSSLFSCTTTTHGCSCAAQISKEPNAKWDSWVCLCFWAGVT